MKASKSIPCRVLFVDDVTHILKGLIRNLNSIEPDWEFFCESNAQDALVFLEKRVIDVVISDLRMPGMDGAEFLKIVQQKHPQTIRFILSGQAGQELLFHAASSSHRCFTKPCEADVLVRAIHETMEASRIMANKKTKEIVLRIGQLPPLPALYNDLVATLNNPNSNVDDIVQIVSQDPAIVSKIMQVSNSAYFGMGNVTNLNEATLLLGMEILKGLVLVGKVFEQIPLKDPESDFIKNLWFHSIQTGSIARDIAQQYSGNKKLADEAFTSGILHDIGKLIFHQVFGEEYLKLLKNSNAQNIILWRLEKFIYGNSHAEIGAYLLKLWGLPATLSDAVEFHHAPHLASQKSFSVLTATHLANVLEHEQDGNRQSYISGKMDIAYLQSLKLPDNLDHWKQMVVNK